MSYPAEIRTLIIEDERETIEQYRRIFEHLRESFPLLAEPSVAESYSDAETALQAPDIYHLVILDLALPEAIGSPRPATARGLGLVPTIANREEYPIPVLMIVTADPRRITDMPALDQQLRTMFWRHWVISKSDRLTDDLRWGIQAAQEYAGVGIHVVGDEAAQRPWPLLSPREEDLLRRTILHKSGVGADLRWWSVGRGTAGAAWVKVLHGRVILPGPKGHSRERFLKLVSAEDGENARQSAELLGSKLPHGQLLHYLAAGSRALLVTDKAGPDHKAPQRLGELLASGDALDTDAIDRIAHDVVDQLQRLSDASSSTMIVGSVLWPSHDESRLRDGWARAGGQTADDPSSLLIELRQRPELLIVKKRLCHGDLHAGNVAIGEDSDQLRAYVIDAGVMAPSVWPRDVAVLEVSTLLHIDFGEAPNPVLSLSTLFDGTDPHGKNIDWQRIDPNAGNAARLIVSLRKSVRAECDEKCYVVLLLDFLLIQIGGVAFGTTYNKLVSAADAVLLLRLLKQWYGKLYLDVD
jgi:CheY-like chemotaxis protein